MAPLCRVGVAIGRHTVRVPATADASTLQPPAVSRARTPGVRSPSVSDREETKEDAGSTGVCGKPAVVEAPPRLPPHEGRRLSRRDEADKRRRWPVALSSALR